jgi:hypothetical protein
MRIRKVEWFLLISFILVFIDCKSFKSFESKGSYYKGEVKIIGEGTTKLKFRISFDSLYNLNLKFYTSAGFKVGDIKIYNDSISINNLIDASYENYIKIIFYKINQEIIVNKFLFYLLTERKFEKWFDLQKGLNCMSENSLDNDKITIYSRECRKMFTIIQKRDLTLKYNYKFEVFSPKEVKVELSFKKI